MASTSTYGPGEEETDPFLAKRFDVVINYRGPDTREDLAKPLYDSLRQAGIQVYLDVAEIGPGANIPSAIYTAKVHVVIFSRLYVESAWCLYELASMCQTKARIVPLFYDVDRSDFRCITNGVEEAFSKHRKKGRFQRWKDCFQNVSVIPSFEFKRWNVHIFSDQIDIVIEEERSRLRIGHSSSLDYIRGLTDLASTFNWGIVVYILGSYVLILSNPVFWLCWSILVTEAVIIENPLLGIDESNEAKKPYGPSEHRRAGAVILKVGMSIALNTMLLSSQDIAQRQIKILLFVTLSIILIEGIMPILIVREELRMRIHSGKGMHMMRHITEGHDWKAANFLRPSVLDAMIGVTGVIVLGGDLGSLMPQTPFWIFISIFVVDLLAEVIHRFDCGKRSLSAIPEEDLPKISRVAIILRLVVEVCLCYLMTREICQDSYFPSHMDANACNGQCQERSKQLLITMVVLGGFQAAGTVVTPLFSSVIGPHYAPSILLFVVVFLAYVLQFLTYKLFNGLKYVIKIMYTQNESDTRLPV